MRRKKEITFEDVEKNPELHIKYLEQQTNKNINKGALIYNIYTGIRPADPQCPTCGQGRDFIDGSWKCRICEHP